MPASEEGEERDGDFRIKLIARRELQPRYNTTETENGFDRASATGVGSRSTYSTASATA